MPVLKVLRVLVLRVRRMTAMRPCRVPRRQFLAITGAAACSLTAAPARADARDGARQGTGAVRRLTHAGFLDLQVNGFAGVDFNDPATTPDQVRHAAAVMRSHGVTRFLPTIISSSLATFERCARTLLDGGRPGDRRHSPRGAVHLARRTARAGHIGARTSPPPRSTTSSGARTPPTGASAWSRSRPRCPVPCRSSSTCAPPGFAWGSVTRRPPPSRSATRCALAPPSRRTSATGARTCCPGTRTSSGNSSRPTS